MARGSQPSASSQSHGNGTPRMPGRMARKSTAGPQRSAFSDRLRGGNLGNESPARSTRSRVPETSPRRQHDTESEDETPTTPRRPGMAERHRAHRNRLKVKPKKEPRVKKQKPRYR